MPTHRRQRPLAAAPRRPQAGRSRYFTLWRHGRAPSAPHNPASRKHTVVTVVARVSWSSPPPMGAAHAVRRTQHRFVACSTHAPTAVVVARRRSHADEQRTTGRGAPSMHDAATNIYDDDDTPREKKTRACARGFTAAHDVEGEKPNGRCCCCRRDLQRRPPPPLYPGGAHSLTASHLRRAPCRVCVSAAATARVRLCCCASFGGLHCTAPNAAEPSSPQQLRQRPSRRCFLGTKRR